MPGRYRPLNTGTRTVRTIKITKKTTLPNVFDCLFCNSEQSVRVTLDRKHKLGTLRCNKCANKFQCSISYIECEVDVHAKWIDACEEVAKEEVKKGDDSGDGKGDGKERVRENGTGKKRRMSREDEEIGSVAKRCRVGS